MDSLISVVIPVFNEQENLEQLVQRCLDSCRKMARPFEIILVDDGSKDSSPQKITRFAEENDGQVIGVLLNRNYGQHAAVMAGFAESRGEIVVTLDADLQNPPEEIPKLVKAVEDGFDVVGTVRVPRCDTLFRRIGSFVVNKVAQKTMGVTMHDYGCMLRAYRRHIVDAMLQCQERSTFIPLLANGFARNTTEIEVSSLAAGHWFWRVPYRHAIDLWNPMGCRGRFYAVCRSFCICWRAVYRNGFTW